MSNNLPNDPASAGQDDQNQPVGSVTAGGKERMAGESTPITEYTRNVDLEPEVEGWLEKLEREDSQLPQPVIDDATGQVVLDDVTAQTSQFKVVLPLTKEEVQKGLHHKVMDSVRWLAEWCLRMVKMFGNKVAYRRQ
jgi:hypothetical protein